MRTCMYQDMTRSERVTSPPLSAVQAYNSISNLEMSIPEIATLVVGAEQNKPPNAKRARDHRAFCVFA